MGSQQNGGNGKRTDWFNVSISTVITIVVLIISAIVAYYEVVAKLHSADAALKNGIELIQFKIDAIKLEQENRRKIVYDVPSLISDTNQRLINFTEALNNLRSTQIGIETRLRELERAVDRLGNRNPSNRLPFELP